MESQPVTPDSTIVVTNKQVCCMHILCFEAPEVQHSRTIAVPNTAPVHALWCSSTAAQSIKAHPAHLVTIQMLIL